MRIEESGFNECLAILMDDKMTNMEEPEFRTFIDEDEEIHRPIMATIAVVMYLIAGCISSTVLLPLFLICIVLILNSNAGIGLVAIFVTLFVLLILYLWMSMCLRLLNGKNSDLLLPAALNLSAGIVLLMSFIIYTMLRIAENHWGDLLDGPWLAGMSVCSWFMLSGILGFVSTDAHEKWVLRIQHRSNPFRNDTSNSLKNELE